VWCELHAAHDVDIGYLVPRAFGSSFSRRRCRSNSKSTPLALFNSSVVRFIPIPVRLTDTSKSLSLQRWTRPYLRNFTKDEAFETPTKPGHPARAANSGSPSQPNRVGSFPKPGGLRRNSKTRSTISLSEFVSSHRQIVVDAEHPSTSF